MLTRVLCRIFGGHQDTWPRTGADGVTRVRCARCHRTSRGVSLRDGLPPPQRRGDPRDSRVVIFPPREERIK